MSQLNWDGGSNSLTYSDHNYYKINIPFVPYKYNVNSKKTMLTYLVLDSLSLIRI